MQKWEYLYVKTVDNKVEFVNEQPQRNLAKPGQEYIYEFLNRVGQEGWEVVGFSEANIILKRPLPE